MGSSGEISLFGCVVGGEGNILESVFGGSGIEESEDNNEIEDKEAIEGLFGVFLGGLFEKIDDIES